MVSPSTSSHSCPIDWMDHSVVILAEVIFCSVPFLSCPSWRLPSFPSFLFLAMRYQLWYVRCDDPSSHGRLRVSPSDDVTKLASGIAPMTQLFAADMWLVDGFLKVHLQKDGPEYFVPAKHVQWSEDGCMQSWKPLSDDMWFSRAWYLQPTKATSRSVMAVISIS